MDRSEGDQRLWFVVDELDALGEIDGLKDALARLRKFGGRTILGFQSIAQVSSTYGKGAADTIVENCGNTLILRCSASEHGGTSEFASKLIGQREVMHTTRSKSRQATAWLGTTTTSEHVKIEPAVMASEIERLPDLHGFLKFASIPDWRRVMLSPQATIPHRLATNSRTPPTSKATHLSRFLPTAHNRATSSRNVRGPNLPLCPPRRKGRGASLRRPLGREHDVLVHRGRRRRGEILLLAAGRRG